MVYVVGLQKWFCRYTNYDSKRGMEALNSGSCCWICNSRTRLSKKRSLEVQLGRVVEYNPDGVPDAGAHAAHTVAEVDAVVSLRAMHGPIVNRERHRITLVKWHDLDTTLHARPLFGQNELAAREIDEGLREEDCDLDRKCESAVEILVEAVEVSRNILEEKRRGSRLTDVVASLDE